MPCREFMNIHSESCTKCTRWIPNYTFIGFLDAILDILFPESLRGFSPHYFWGSLKGYKSKFLAYFLRVFQKIQTWIFQHSSWGPLRGHKHKVLNIVLVAVNGDFKTYFCGSIRGYKIRFLAYFLSVFQGYKVDFSTNFLGSTRGYKRGSSTYFWESPAG